MVGAGPSGLVAAKHALEAGFDVTVFEASEALGGQWHTTGAHSGVWPGMRTNTSRAMTAFSDFPAPAEHPLHPSAEQVHAYLGAYARAFGLVERIRFGTRVEDVQPGWTVDGEPFDGVVVASGRFRRPRLAPGLGAFGGEVVHAFDYPGAEPFRDRVTLVYGNGISGLEIASDLAPHAPVVSAFRKPRYVIQKVVVGVSSDWQWYTLFGALERRVLPRDVWARRQRERILRIAGDPADFGAPAPSEDLLVAGVSLCQDYLEQVRDGSIVCRPAIASVAGREVTFTDGSTQAVEAIVCATGYDVDIPYLDVLGPDLALFHRTFHPDLPGLGVIGQFLAQGPYFPLLELQARWITAVWSGEVALPGGDEMRDVIAQPRPPLDPHNALALTLSEQLGAAPEPADWPDLHEALVFGPMLPPRYRLSGPGARADAAGLFAQQLAASPQSAVDPADVEALRAFGEPLGYGPPYPRPGAASLEPSGAGAHHPGPMRAAADDRLLVDGSPGYDEARTVWNAMVDRRPQAIVRCANADDVAEAIRFGRERDLEIGVRCGGHSVLGLCVPEGGLMVDLTPMGAVRVDPERRRAWVQGGALLGALDREAMGHGLTTTAGNVSHTGVGGLTLGGGMGWLARRLGLSCDNVAAFELITAAGDRLHVDETGDPELFWGLRGGGGNFGVVSEFEFRLHPVAGRAHVVELFFALEHAPAVLRGWRDLNASAPRAATFTAWVGESQSPALPPQWRDRPVASVGFVWAGEPALDPRLLPALRALGRPIAERVEELPYLKLQRMDDTLEGHALRRYWKGHYFRSLPDEAIDAFLLRGTADGYGEQLPAASLQAYGGAIADVPDADSAFSQRDAMFEFVASARWSDAAEDDERIAAARRYAASLEPFASGMYVNVMSDEGAAGVARAYPPAKLARLRALKTAYDPDNVFHLNQNIAPA